MHLIIMIKNQKQWKSVKIMTNVNYNGVQLSMLASFCFNFGLHVLFAFSVSSVSLFLFLFVLRPKTLQHFAELHLALHCISIYCALYCFTFKLCNIELYHFVLCCIGLKEED